MSVQIEVSKYQGGIVSYVLVITDPLAMMQSTDGITVVLEPDAAIELHDRLGKEIKCDGPACPCYAYGWDEGEGKRL